MQIDPCVFLVLIQRYLVVTFFIPICDLQFMSHYPPPPAAAGPDKLRSSAPDRCSRDTRGNAGSIVIYVPKQVVRVGHKFVFIGRSA